MKRGLRFLYRFWTQLVFSTRPSKFDFDIIPTSNSQAGQESWVIHHLSSKRNGFYLEVGGYHSSTDSNTCVLENEFNWKGLAIEIVKERCDEYNAQRRNPCIHADAKEVDYLELLGSNNAPPRIDYLQIDIEPAINSLEVLYKIPFQEYSFSCITFEHDLYAHPLNVLVKWKARRFLIQNGYRIAFANVKTNKKLIFEDWYIQDHTS